MISEPVLASHMTQLATSVTFVGRAHAPKYFLTLTRLTLLQDDLRAMVSALALYVGISSLCLLYSTGSSKVYRGTVSSQRAWEEKGQFVTKFCFHGEVHVGGL